MEKELIEPATLEEAITKNCDASDWWESMICELWSQTEKGTWRMLNELPRHKKALNAGWVFKIKPDGRKKSRLVVKGYSQVPGIAFGSTYAPIAGMATLRTILSIAAKGWFFKFQFDVVTAYLHAELKEEI